MENSTRISDLPNGPIGNGNPNGTNPPDTITISSKTNFFKNFLLFYLAYKLFCVYICSIIN